MGNNFYGVCDVNWISSMDKILQLFLFVQVMFECDKYNLVHEFFRKIQKSSLPNALTYRGIILIYLCHILFPISIMF